MGLKDWVAKNVAGPSGYGAVMGRQGIENGIALGRTLYLGHGTRASGASIFIFDEENEMELQGFQPYCPDPLNRPPLEDSSLLSKHTRIAGIAIAIQSTMTAASNFMNQSNASEFNRSLGASTKETLLKLNNGITAQDVLSYLKLPVPDLAAAREPLCSIATILVDSGLRPEECFRTQWDNVRFADGRHGVLFVPFGKTQAARRAVPMTPRVRAVLENHWEAQGRPREGWVWPTLTRSGHIEASSLKKQHRRALRVPGVRPFVLYSLRHTFLTRLGESGCDAWTLARIAGHSSIGISARYVHPSEEAMLDAMSRLGGHKSGHTTELQADRNSNSKLLTH